MRLPVPAARILRLAVLVLFTLAGPSRLAAWQMSGKEYSQMLGIVAVLRATVPDRDFAADIEVTMSAKETGQRQQMPMSCAAKGGKLRVEINLADAIQASGGAEGPAAIQVAAALGQAGLARIIVLHEIGQPTATVILPGLRVSAQEPIPASVAKDLSKAGTKAVTIKAAGSEIVDGVEFRKNLMTDDEGDVVLVWTQSDRDHFPALFESDPSSDNPILLRTIAMERTAPGDDRFEVPSGFRKLGSMAEIQALVQQRLMNLLRSGGATRPR